MGSSSASLASSMAFSAVPPMPIPSMPGGHQPAPISGHHFQHPVHHRIGGVEHGELGLGLGAATFGRHVHFQLVTGNDLVMDHAGRIVAGVAARTVRIFQDRGAQRVVGFM